MNWIYIAIVGAFALGVFIGMAIGRKKGIDEITHRQMQMDATRMWTNAFKGYMGGEK